MHCISRESADAKEAGWYPPPARSGPATSSTVEVGTGHSATLSAISERVMTKSQDDLLMEQIKDLVALAKARGQLVDHNAAAAMLAGHFDRRSEDDIARKICEHAQAEGVFTR